MRILLDTHAFLQFCAGHDAFPIGARELIEDQRNEKLLSIASVWEISIKLGIGKLHLALPFAETISTGLVHTGSSLLAISVQHLEKLLSLDHHHRDPFDRLLIAQCLVEDLAIVSVDTAIDAYGIRRVWK